MVMKIEHVPEESGTTFVLTGRITSPDVQQLKATVGEAPKCVALDLRQVQLVDLDAVRFLAAAQRRGIELRHIPPYVREWVLLERTRLSESE